MRKFNVVFTFTSSTSLQTLPLETLSGDDLCKKNSIFFRCSHVFIFFNYFNFVALALHARRSCVSSHWRTSGSYYFKHKALLFAMVFSLLEAFHAVLNRKRCCYSDDYLLNNEWSPWIRYWIAVCLLGMKQKHVSTWYYSSNAFYRRCVTMEKTKNLFSIFCWRSVLKYIKFTYKKKT